MPHEPCPTLTKLSPISALKYDSTGVEREPCCCSRKLICKVTQFEERRDGSVVRKGTAKGVVIKGDYGVREPL